MNSARIFASRNHIIDWINQVLKIQMAKIQQLGSGVIYCLLLDSGYPQRIPITKLKWYANNQVDYIYNFKILQNSFSHLGIDKKIQINKLIKAKYQDNLDFIQWLKWFIQPKIDYKQYDAQKRRQNREVYLDFYEHKILKLPSQSHKTKQKSSYKNKHNIKINKKLKLIYNTNTTNFLEIYDCKTDQSDYEFNIIEQKKYSKLKPKLLKTTQNFRTKKPSINILALDEFMAKTDEQSTQDNKQNACMSMNNTGVVSETPMNLQCMYSSPKQIKKFFFPERFSERLKRRVDVINGLRKSEIKRIEERQRQTLEKDGSYKREKYSTKNLPIFVDEEQSESEVQVEA